MGTAEEFRLERDLYRAALRLRDRTDVDRALAELLELLVVATAAARGYLEVGAAERDRRWSLSHGCTTEQYDAIRAVTSRGIVSATLSGGRPLHVPLAMLDERFAHQPSVREQRLEAVLCVPIGGTGAGVLYLEGQRGAGPFSDRAIALAEDMASQIGPSVEAAARTIDAIEEDPTCDVRKRLRVEGIVGRSSALAHVLSYVEPFIERNVTILITGPNGTGKTQLARAIHENSPRRAGPFLELNCAAIPEGLIESELFGAMPGAFPGARKTTGKVGAADGGTLFLDEIVEIPYAAQGKLLQLLQSKQYYALASTRIATANIRLIAATNANLPAMIEARRFREDLYFRLNIVEVRMPSLSERRTDIPYLVDELLVRIANEHNFAHIPASSGFRYAMESRDWPGNIRQLRNQVEAAAIRASVEGAPQVEVRHLSNGTTEINEQPTFHEATRQYQRDFLRRELEASNWNISAVAARLDLSRAHVYNLINQFGLARG